MKRGILLVSLWLLSTAPAFAAVDLLVFFDVSGSTSKETISNYFQQYRHAIEGLGAGDSAVAALINGNTRGNFSPFGAMTIPEKGALESPTGYKEMVKKERTKALLVVKNHLDQAAPAGNTDILSCLKQAKDYFDNSGHDGEKALLIFSDMVEETKTLNLRGLKSGQVEKKVQLIKPGLPSLAGVKVYAIGATGATPEEFNALEGFWQKVFVASGASKVQYRHSLDKL